MTDRELGSDDSMNDATPRRAVAEEDAWPGAGLPELPQHDVGARTAARIRSRAMATLRRRESAAQPGLAKLWLWYDRAIEPGLWLGLGLGYCAWAAAGALAILH